jgi:hypothetical protein
MEQANIITINEDEQIDKNHSEIFDENEHNDQQISVTEIIKTPYISQGNVVRCVTGSFD